MFFVLELEISSNTKRYWAFSRTPSLNSDPFPSAFIGIGTRLVSILHPPLRRASRLPPATRLRRRPFPFDSGSAPLSIGTPRRPHPPSFLHQ